MASHLAPRRGMTPLNRRLARPAMALLLSSAALLLAGTAQAQEIVSDEGAVELSTVWLHGGSVVDADSSIVAGYSATGSKTVNEVIDIPAQVSVVTAVEMQTRAPDSLHEALSYTSSVSVDEYGSDNRYDFYRIRGFLQSGTGTYRDGLPLRSFNFTGGRIEPYSVQRIEVLKGSTSTLFGLNGPGGLVNVMTKRPQGEPFGEVYTTVGKDHGEVGFDLGGVLDVDGTLTWRLTGKEQDSTDGSRYLEDDRGYLAAGLTWKPTDATSLTLLANYYDTDGNTGNGIPVGSTASHDTFFGEPSLADMDRVEKSVGYEFSHAFDNGLTLRQNLRWSNITMLYEQAYLDSNSPTGRYAYRMNGEITRFAVDNQLEYSTTFGDVESRTLMGVDYTDDDLLETSFTGTAGAIDPNNPVYCGTACINLATTGSVLDMTQQATGIYVQEELTFADQWIVTLGGRHDRVRTEDGTGDNTQSAFTKRFGLTYKATEDLAFYGNYSESFDALGAGYVPYMPEAPKPQQGRQYEAGVKYRPAGSDALISLAYFDLSQSNVPRFATIGGVPAYWQIGQVDVRGLELEGRMALNDRVNLNFAYSYWDAKVVNGDNPGNRPLLTPKSLASVWADYSFDQGALSGLKLGLGARYLGARFSDDGNTVRIGSNVVVDAMASYQVAENTELALNVTNLFDKDYVSSYNFTNSAVFYGDAREVKATLRHRW
ncbi:TonB-dependent siderophore receptor [Gemmobacter serpentinus]|uniref:TonB-dependent siderophore receptor n=1 Tax=Gemmobacter serpentinus TaxID=2652247 RepID=UPI001CF67DA0|nr:TonB-dependent siderophore receptor [Gemmobacter serpentinus]